MFDFEVVTGGERGEGGDCESVFCQEFVGKMYI